MGLPMYIVIYQTPENGCDIQNSACSRRGAMLRLRRMNTLEGRNTEHANAGGDGFIHVTKVLNTLMSSCTNSNLIVCTDSYFASVGCYEELKIIGLRFIGVVNRSTKRFPMAHLSQIKLVNRGYFSGLMCRDLLENPKFLSFVCIEEH